MIEKIVVKGESREIYLFIFVFSDVKAGTETTMEKFSENDLVV